MHRSMQTFQIVPPPKPQLFSPAKHKPKSTHILLHLLLLLSTFTLSLAASSSCCSRLAFQSLHCNRIRFDSTSTKTTTNPMIPSMTNTAGRSSLTASSLGKRALSSLSSKLSTSTSTSLQSTASSIHSNDTPITQLTKSIIHGSSATSAPKNKLSFAIAGGGSAAISSLASTAGASSVLLNGSILYDRISFCQYISEHLKEQDSHGDGNNGFGNANINIVEYGNPHQTGDGNSDGSISASTSTSSVHSSYMNHKQNQFGFASSGSSILLSQAALHHAFQQVQSTTSQSSSIGIGCTSTLVSHGREHRNSRAHISILRGDGVGMLYNIKLSAMGYRETVEKGTKMMKVNGSGEGDLGANLYSGVRRSRGEEEDLLARLILYSVLRFEYDVKANANVNINVDAGGEDTEDAGNDAVLVEQNHDNDGEYDKMLDRNGDQLERFHFYSKQYHQDPKRYVQNCAEQIIQKNGALKAIIVAPQHQHQLHDYQEGGKNAATAAVQKMVPLTPTVIPSEPIIFPGSFNPPHIGHASLASAAVKTMTRKKRQELQEYFDKVNGGNDGENESKPKSNPKIKRSRTRSVMEDMWNTTDYQSFESILKDDKDQLHDNNDDHGPFSLLFEMSLTNADKPAMEATEASRRVALFGDLFLDKSMSTASVANTTTEIPNLRDWGVLLTSAPLFIDKARLMKQYLAPSSTTYLRQPNKRQMTFVIGTDTMVRILNPKYYNNEYEDMLEAMRDMRDEGVHFVVGGRLEQVKGKDGAGDDELEEKFVTGEEELEGLPEDVRDMFSIIQEEDFRVDISSTELRKKMVSGSK